MNEDQHDESAGTPEWRVPADEQLKADAYHVWKPRPLLRSIHWKPSPAPEKDAATGSYDVFLDQRVFKAMHEHLWNAAPSEEAFGFLIGDLCEDPDSGRRYVIVSTAVPSKFRLKEGPDQMPREALIALELEADRRNGVMAGWYRRRLAGPVELSPQDKKMHEMHFPEPWQVAFLFITDHDHPAGGCFRRALRGLNPDAPLPFYEMVSNESLLAKGVRRSRLDWVNIETTDAIEPDPPSRPERPPEPELEVATDVPELHLPLDAAVEAGEGAVDEPEPADSVEVAGPILPVLDLEPVSGDQGVTDVQDEAAPAAPARDEELRIERKEETEEDTPETPGDSGSGGRQEVDLPLMGADELLAELEATADELEMTVVDSGEEDAAVPDLESLLGPEWDSEDGPALQEPISVDEVDLDSFVVEVERADVAGQVGPAPDIERLEPAWDDAESAEVEEPDAGVEIALPVAEPDLAPEPEPEPQPEPDSESDIEAPAAEAADAASEVRSEEPAPKGKTPRSRRRAVLVAILVVAAIAASLVIALSRSGPEAGGENDVTEAPAAGAGGGAPSGQGAIVVPPPAAEGAAGGAPQTATPAVADTAAPAATAVDMKRLGDSLLESISRYYGQAVARDEGQVTCADLQTSFVEVEDRWIAYNVQGRARFQGRLPEELATRDERLYAGVQDVEREFNRSGCERP